MDNITDEMIIDCLKFIQEKGGEVSRYVFDNHITINIRINESFNIIPQRLLDDGLITMRREGNSIKIAITPLGIEKLSMS